MKRMWIVVVLVGIVIVTACGGKATPFQSPLETPGAQLPNPASVNCIDKGGQLEIRTAADGSQTGYCIFADGSECEEWAYYRGECAPGQVKP